MNGHLKMWKQELLGSLLLGVVCVGLLGYGIGLRILILNPELAGNSRNVIFLLLNAAWLYGAVGLLVGAGLGMGITVFSWLTKRKLTGPAFYRTWLQIFLVGSFALLAFLIWRRQNLPTGRFDNGLVTVYWLALLLLGIWFYRALPNPAKTKGKTFPLLSLWGFFSGFAFLLLAALAGTLLWCGLSSPRGVSGNLSEIHAALNRLDEQTKVALIGWDGAEWTVIQDLFERGELPNLRRLVDQGVSGPLSSLEKLKSPLIWNSISTGKLPEKHGITDFGTFQLAGMDNNFIRFPNGIGFYRLVSTLQPTADLPVTSTMRRCQALWNLLSDAGCPVGVVSWWGSWPVEPVEGFMLSDRFTHSIPNPRASVLTLRQGQIWPPDDLDQVAGFCRSPESVTNEELRRFIPQIAEIDLPEDWKNAAYYDWNPLYQLKTGYSATESYRGAGLYLYRKYRPRFFAFYVEGTDLVSHYFWEYYRPQDFEHVPQEEIERFGSVLPAFYRYADEELGEILSQLEPGTDVILVSDHGFGPFRNPRVTLRSGSHRKLGVFIACGPHFRPATKVEGASVLDLTPTILYLFGLPGAKDMDGRVLVESLRPEMVDQRPPDLIASYECGPRVASASGSLADPAIKEQLRSLGYIP